MVAALCLMLCSGILCKVHAVFHVIHLKYRVIYCTKSKMDVPRPSPEIHWSIRSWENEFPLQAQRWNNAGVQLHLHRKLSVSRCSAFSPCMMTQYSICAAVHSAVVNAGSQKKQQQHMHTIKNLFFFGRLIDHRPKLPAPMLFHAACQDPRLFPRQSSAPLLLCLSGGGERRGGWWGIGMKLCQRG